MQTTASSRASRQFIPINPLALSCSDVLCFDVFLKVDANATPKLYCSRRLRVNPRQLQQLIDSGITKLYVESDSYNSYLEDLRNNRALMLSGDGTLESHRTALMCEVVRAVLREQFHTDDTSAIVSTCCELSHSINSILHQCPVPVSRLHSEMFHDHELCTHSSNVAFYITLLARQLGFSGDELDQIVVGALLHDIGNLQVQEQILCKQKRLSEFELREVRKHSRLGLMRLVNAQQNLTYGQLMMVYQHHEKLNGSGYPVGVPDEEIHPWAKMCAVVDTFAALTSNRSYRKPLTHGTAMAVLEKAAETELDEDIVKCWKSLVADAASVR